MKRKNKSVLKAVKVAQIFVLSFALSSFASVNGENSAEQKTEKPTAYYTLSEYDGRIAVFENGSSKPIEVFDTYISSLPYTEQNEIINGITAESKSELQKLIEDYTS